MCRQEGVKCDFFFCPRVWTPSEQMETIWAMQLYLPSSNPLPPGLYLPSVLSEAESLHVGHNARLKAGVMVSFLETKACSLSSSAGSPQLVGFPALTTLGPCNHLAYEFLETAFSPTKMENGAFTHQQGATWARLAPPPKGALGQAGTQR